MFHFQPSTAEFAKLSKSANTVPVYCSLLSDQLTPVSAFDRIAEGADHAFLLESVVGGEKIARYSFLAAEPVAIFEAKDDGVKVTDKSGTREVAGVDPLDELESLLAQYNAAQPPNLPRFLGGAVGYAGYDIARHYEKLGTPPKDDRNLPDAIFGIYDQMVIFDHVQKLIHVVVHAHLDEADSEEAAYETACDRIKDLIAKLEVHRPDPIKPLPVVTNAKQDYDSSVSEEEFEVAVDRCKKYIRAGDIFQVVLSHRLSSTTEASPYDIYRALRVINPSPFMFYVQSPTVTLVGASPEILCRLEDRTVSSRPLAGTRPRGRNEAEDLGLETELLNDPKERAEHVMLVDLGRNDLGRICEPGTVKIDDLMSIERYSHVMHICSNVSGELAKGKTAFDAIKSVLPVGTVSGAPKVRAMQIIDELEPLRRGPYGGAIGYIDFAGNMDTCIALRTLVITPTADGKWRADAQVGAGIVADSEPKNEYQETRHKAKSMLTALDIADAWTKDTQ
jgi:anthranilate synthase component I